MRIKQVVAAIAALVLLAAGALVVSGQGEAQFTDAPSYFKAKCVMCHGPKAEKKFDAAKTDDELVDTVMKGKKGEKPPNMPNYSEKGITADQAKALVAYMKSLK